MIGSQQRRMNEVNNKLKELDVLHRVIPRSYRDNELEETQEANNRKKYYEDLEVSIYIVKLNNLMYSIKFSEYLVSIYCVCRIQRLMMMNLKNL